MKDLIVYVADGYQEKVLEALLSRVPIASKTRTFTYDIAKNPGHDSGSYNDSHELLRPSINQYHHAIVILDLEGTGVEDLGRQQIEDNIQDLLNRNGWEGRSCVIVIAPELERWMWVDNPNVENAIGWEKEEGLYEWARNRGYLVEGQTKPDRPKEVLEEALRISDTSKSASIYKKIAENVSYIRCTDESFQKLISQLILWFPREAANG